MSFNPKLEIGQILSNKQLVEVFQCGNMGGMRRSHATNTLVIISDYTKGLYQDKWIGGTLHYTGMGKVGDQDINWAQNATLAECGSNGVDVHLFEVIDVGEYIYCGRVCLAEEPYTDIQPDDNGHKRLVWMFPVRPVPENNVRKPEMFVFDSMDDYYKRGQDVDQEYIKRCETQRKTTARPAKRKSNSIVGKTVNHKTCGKGIVKSFDGKTISISFSGTVRSFDYQSCVEKQLLELLS